jgi:hypothetical protein
MNKLIVALCASAFAFGSACALAQGGADSSLKPLSKMETQDAKAARVAAKAKWDAMTPEQQAAARKAAQQKKLADATAMDMVATENMQYDAKQGAKDAAASKAQPVPTKAERQAEGTTMQKKATGQ